MSKQFSLNASDLQKQLKSALIYSAPVVLLYISPLLAALQKEGHQIAVSDFYITKTTLNAIIVWALMQVEGLLIRWGAGK